MGFGWQELLIILVVVALIFGTSRLKNLGSDLGGALKGFKKSLKEDSENKDQMWRFLISLLIMQLCSLY